MLHFADLHFHTGTAGMSASPQFPHKSAEDLWDPQIQQNLHGSGNPDPLPVYGESNVALR